MNIYDHWVPNRGPKNAIKLDKANCSNIKTGFFWTAVRVPMALDILYALPRLQFGGLKKITLYEGVLMRPALILTTKAEKQNAGHIGVSYVILRLLWLFSGPS